MQTEPIGFKGTKNEWVGKPIFKGTELLAYQIASKEGVVAAIQSPKYHNEPKVESVYDFALMAASKKMAIALQSLIEIMKIEALNERYPSDFDFAKEALKQAGL